MLILAQTSHEHRSRSRIRKELSVMRMRYLNGFVSKLYKLYKTLKTLNKPAPKSADVNQGYLKELKIFKIRAQHNPAKKYD